MGKAEVPEFCEVVSLARGLWAAGLAGTLAVIGAGLWLSALAPWSWAELAGGGLLTAGSMAGVALVRLRHFETTVTRYGVRAGFGLLCWSFPRHGVTSVQVAQATGWRRLFAPLQVEVELKTGKNRYFLPSKEALELQRLLLPHEKEDY